MSSRKHAKILFCFEVIVISNMKGGGGGIGYVEVEIEVLLFMFVHLERT